MNNKLLTIIAVCMIMITVKLYIPDAEAKIDGKSWSQLQLDFDFKKAVLDSESFSSAIGDNKTVDLTFTTQIAGPEEKAAGVFIDAIENKKGTKGFRRSPQVKRGPDDDYLKFYPYGIDYGLEPADLKDWQESRDEKF